MRIISQFPGVLRNLGQQAGRFFPIHGFRFDRPLVLFQSDDWGRVGLRDREGAEELRSVGLNLGERPYDFYTLETAEDLAALVSALKQHRDSAGRHPCVQMNCLTGNLHFSEMAATGYRTLQFLPLAEGLPSGWNRPGLIEGYRDGIAQGLFHPALHGTFHFCRQAVERNALSGGERAELLHKLWRAGTPYIHWRMPWIGYEYWDPEQPADERFLRAEMQQESIGHAFGLFAKLFLNLPRSACAPGYRADTQTHKAWAQHGIRIAQNGPGQLVPPHFDRYGLLQLSRTVEFEPATNSSCTVEGCMRQAERCFARGLPAIVSVHSINFHSTVRDFRSRTLHLLNEFLGALESRHSDLLYLHDEDLYELVNGRAYRTANGETRVNALQEKFVKSRLEQIEQA